MNSTLEDVALFNVAGLLYNDPEIREELLNLEGSDKEWEKLISDKASKLFLYPICQKRVAAIASSVGLKIKRRNQIFRAMHLVMSIIGASHCPCFGGISYGHENDPWTPEESLVIKKTVEMLVLEQKINVAFRFTLACDFDLEDHIISLWHQMPEAMKQGFYRLNLSSKVIFWFKTLSFADYFCFDEPFSDAVQFVLQRIKEDYEFKYRLELISLAGCRSILGTRNAPEVRRRRFRILASLPYDSFETDEELRNRKGIFVPGVQLLMNTARSLRTLMQTEIFKYQFLFFAFTGVTALGVYKFLR